MLHDLIIKDARIVDGAGGPSLHGAVAIADGRITAVGAVDGRAKTVINASGLAVTPGFIDFHTHYDAQVAWDPLCTPSCQHGVTTVLMGNCGYALAPVRPRDREYVMGMFSAVEGVPKSTLLHGLSWEWETQPQFLRWLQKRGLGINVAAQVGHSAVRRYVLGAAAHEREATREEIEEMVRLVEAGLAGGATGFTTTRVAHQKGEFGEPVPSFLASEEEVFALADPLRKRGRGPIGINPRTKTLGLSLQDQDQLRRLAKSTGRPVIWNEFSPREEAPGWRSIVTFMEEAQKDGAFIYAVTRAQPQALRFRDADVGELGPAWRELVQLPVPQRLQQLGSDALRSTLAEEAASARNAERLKRVEVRMTALSNNSALEGRSISQIARERGTAAGRVLVDLLQQEEFRTWLMIVDPRPIDQNVLEQVLRSPPTIIGLSDAGAHLDNRCPVDYTTYTLAHWVRETRRFTLEDAVRRMTSVPAGILGLGDRGVVRPGAAADLCIINLETVAPEHETVLHDLPGGGPRLFKGAAGIEWVIVNGQPVLRKGEHTGALPGRLVAA